MRAGPRLMSHDDGLPGPDLILSTSAWASSMSRFTPLTFAFSRRLRASSRAPATQRATTGWTRASTRFVRFVGGSGDGVQAVDGRPDAAGAPYDGLEELALLGDRVVRVLDAADFSTAREQNAAQNDVGPRAAAAGSTTCSRVDGRDAVEASGAPGGLTRFSALGCAPRKAG